MLHWKANYDHFQVSPFLFRFSMIRLYDARKGETWREKIMNTSELAALLIIGIALVLGMILFLEWLPVNSARTARAMAAGTVCRGMSMEQVQAVWGSPDEIEIDRYGPSWRGSNQHVTWIYLNPPRTVTFHPAGYVEQFTGR